MTSGRPVPRPARRVLVLGALVSLVLHLILLGAVQRSLRAPLEAAGSAPVTLVMLPDLQAPAAPVPVPEPVPVAPPAAPQTAPVAEPPPAPAQAAPVASNEGTALPDVLDDAHQANVEPAGTALSEAALAALLARQLPADRASEPTVSAGAAPAGPASLPEPVAQALARMPQEGEVDYQVSMGGGDWQVARGTLRWRIDGLRYHVDLTAQAVGLARLLKSNAVSQISEGRITAGGLAPDQFRVLGRVTENAEEDARFDWTGGQLTFLPSGQSLALPEGTQDLLSFFMQFALLPPRTDSLLQPVTNGRKLDRYLFEMTERAPLHLPVGVFDTVRITKLHAPSEDDFDVWLAQDRHYLPVQMRFRARGRLLTLSATAIRVGGLHSAL